jgi:hypothetical protein
VLDEFFAQADGVDLAPLSAQLDALSRVERVRAVRSLDRRKQARLFEAAEGFRPLRLHDLVPADVAPQTEVIHDGRNSLPVFSSFQKRFSRPPGGGGELWGYNEHPLSPAIGPGYFVAEESGDLELRFDYSRVPAEAVDGWPRIRANSGLRGRLVYRGLEDTVRGVSAHVCVGRAAKQAKPIDAWFVLSRADH